MIHWRYYYVHVYRYNTELGAFHYIIRLWILVSFIFYIHIFFRDAKHRIIVYRLSSWFCPARLHCISLFWHFIWSYFIPFGLMSELVNNIYLPHTPYTCSFCYIEKKLLNITTCIHVYIMIDNKYVFILAKS